MEAWFDELDGALSTPVPMADTEGSSWVSDLKTQVDINHYQPAPHPQVIAKEIADGSQSYFVLKNTESKTYMRLNPDEYSVWLLMDGQLTVTELIVEHFSRSGAFARNMVISLVDQLLTNRMLVEKPVHSWSGVKRQLERRSWGNRIAAPARILLSQQLKIPGIDKFITGLYRIIGWLFFTLPVKIVLIVIAVAGFAAFNRIITSPNYRLFSQFQPSELVLLWIAALFPVVIHELGHALTVKHYGREINSGGLMLYFGLPAAFVDTTDIWLENRRARLNVTWNGPYTGLIVGGICAILMWFYPQNPANSFLFKMASVAYLTVLLNLNPLLKYDGYYILSDVLRIPFLRERSLSFIQRGFQHKIVKRERLTRDEWIYIVFGALSVLWTVYALYLAVAFWQTRISSSLQVLLGSNYNVFTKVLQLLSVAAFISLLFLLVLQLIRFSVVMVNRFVRAGGLQRHGQLALIGFALAAIIAVAASRSVEIYRGWMVIAVVSGLSLATLLNFVYFNQTYFFSYRWSGQICLALSLLALALIPLAEEVMPTGSRHAKYLLLSATGFAALGGLLFIFPAIRRIKPIQLLIGLAIAILLAGAEYFLGILNSPLLLLPFLGLIATLDWFSLRRSGRQAGLMLIYSGILVTTIAFLLERYIPRYWGFGILISCVGFWHLILARIPKLSKFEPVLSRDKRAAIGASVMILVKRVISQVFFESGWGGIDAFGRSFTTYTRGLGIDLSITANQFKDGELGRRATYELTDVYGIAFDEIYGLMKEWYGDRFTRRIVSLGIDLIPWQYREVIGELVLGRRDWGMQVNRDRGNQEAERLKLLDRVPLFYTATYDDLKPIAAVLKTRQYAAKDTIIRQGDPGDEFFIIERGKVQIWQSAASDEPRHVQSLGPGQYFGEIALVTNDPRNATAITETPCVLLSLGREDFDSMVKQHVEFVKQLKKNLQNEWILRNMPIFDEMSAFDLNLATSKMKVEAFGAGETVITEGEVGDKFYIIESGELAAYKNINGTSVEVERLTSGDYFGEIALIQNTPRSASIRAITDSTLFSLVRDDFNQLLEDFQRMRQLLEKTSTRRLKSNEA